MSRSLLLASAGVCRAACSSARARRARPALRTSPIVIGTANSLTGVLAPFELAINDGMEVAVDEINAAGGVARAQDQDHPRRREIGPQPVGDRRPRRDREGRADRRADLRRRPRRARRTRGEREGRARDHLRRRTRHRQADGRPADVQHLHGLTDGERDRRRVRVPHAGLAPRVLPLRSRARVHEGRVRGVQDALEEPRREGRR